MGDGGMQRVADALARASLDAGTTPVVNDARRSPEGVALSAVGDDSSGSLACAATPAHAAALFASATPPPQTRNGVVEPHGNIDGGASGACLTTVTLASSVLGLGVPEGEKSAVRFKVEGKDASGRSSKRMVSMDRPFTFEHLSSRLRDDYGALHAIFFVEGTAQYPMRSQVDLDTAIAKSEQPGDSRFAIPLRVITAAEASMPVPSVSSTGSSTAVRSSPSPRHSSVPTGLAFEPHFGRSNAGGDFFPDDSDDPDGEAFVSYTGKGTMHVSPESRTTTGRRTSNTRTQSAVFAGTSLGAGVPPSLHSQSDPGNVFRMNAEAEAEARREHGVGSEFETHQREEEAAALEEHLGSLRDGGSSAGADSPIPLPSVRSGSFVRDTGAGVVRHAGLSDASHPRSSSAADATPSLRPPVEGVRRSMSEPRAAHLEGGFIANDSDTDDELLAEHHRARTHSMAQQGRASMPAAVPGVGGVAGRSILQPAHRPSPPDSPPPGYIHGHTSHSRTGNDDQMRRMWADPYARERGLPAFSSTIAGGAGSVANDGGRGRPYKPNPDGEFIPDPSYERGDAHPLTHVPKPSSPGLRHRALSAGHTTLPSRPSPLHAVGGAALSGAGGAIAPAQHSPHMHAVGSNGSEGEYHMERPWNRHEKFGQPRRSGSGTTLNARGSDASDSDSVSSMASGASGGSGAAPVLGMRPRAMTVPARIGQAAVPAPALSSPGDGNVGGMNGAVGAGMRGDVALPLHAFAQFGSMLSDDANGFVEPPTPTVVRNGTVFTFGAESRARAQQADGRDWERERAHSDLQQRLSSVSAVEDGHSPKPGRWRRGRLLGSGAFGNVYLCLDEVTGIECAVKQVDLSGDEMHFQAKEVQCLEMEIQLLRNLRHENIVRYLGTECNGHHLCIFMEYMAGGSIASRLKMYGPFEEALVRRFTRQIAMGVVYLHENRIVHRDIKGANILVDARGVVKLADFGASKRLQSMRCVSGFKSQVGTPYWMSPEVISGAGHGRKADVWSLGCTVIEMLTTRPPWADYEPMAALFRIGSPNSPVPFPTSISQLALSFLRLCLERDPEHRAHAAELLQHAFTTP